MSSFRLRSQKIATVMVSQLQKGKYRQNLTQVIVSHNYPFCWFKFQKQYIPMQSIHNS